MTACKTGHRIGQIGRNFSGPIWNYNEFRTDLTYITPFHEIGQSCSYPRRDYKGCVREHYRNVFESGYYYSSTASPLGRID
jgi:hypothetical protein